MQEQVRVVAAEGKVAVLINGKLSFSAPPEIAKAIAIALNSQAMLIENDQRQLKNGFMDQAILMRQGIPLGLTSNRKMLDEAHKEAQWNSALRKYMPRAPGIGSKEVFGTPIIRGGA